MKIHKLKTWPDYFKAVKSGEKKFEIRKNDRNFRVGDELILEEYLPHAKQYTGNKILKIVTYVFAGGSFGLDPGFCVMSLSDP